jgi:hypothetical protein
VKKQKLKIVDRDDVPNTYFDDWDTFVIDFPASWKVKEYSVNGVGEIILVRKKNGH